MTGEGALAWYLLDIEGALAITEAQLARLRDLHGRSGTFFGECAECGTAWPCPSAKILWPPRTGHVTPPVQRA